MVAPVKRLSFTLYFNSGKNDQEIWDYLSAFGHAKGAEIKRLAHRQMQRENLEFYDKPSVVMKPPKAVVEEPVVAVPEISPSAPVSAGGGTVKKEPVAPVVVPLALVVSDLPCPEPAPVHHIQKKDVEVSVVVPVAALPAKVSDDDSHDDGFIYYGTPYKDGSFTIESDRSIPSVRDEFETELLL